LKTYAGTEWNLIPETSGKCGFRKPIQFLSYSVIELKERAVFVLCNLVPNSGV
jgi:hypothetical protein